MAEKRSSRKKIINRIITIILVVILIAGICALLYPTLANWYNTSTMSYAIAEYNETVDNMDEIDYDALWAEAEAYNDALRELGSYTALVHPEYLSGYENVLNVTDNGIMGYVTIDKIGVELPIYHGTESSVLSSGAGHLEGTSLPIGGESTHSVISAHRGLPSSKLFSALDEMEIGDTFTITVLNEVLTYQVDQIVTVLPDEIEELYIADGEDYCTLLTCTPYGVNTHRLLVRGTRIETPADGTLAVIDTGLDRDDIMFIIGTALLTAAIVVIVVSIIRRHKRKGGGQKSEENQRNEKQ